MNLETELRELAQTHLDLIQDIQWHDLRRAVVIHLESLEEHDTLIVPRVPVPRVPTRQVCHHIINQKPCPKWTDGTACGATWHPEFLQILEDGQPKWIWMPRQAICRSDQRSRGVRHQQGQLCCTDPNCLRSHAPNWLYAELWAFRWWVQHEFNTGLATGYTLNGDLIGMSTRTANLTLATMPYVDEAYYHKFRWHAPIPQPETYGDMIVTAPSRRANLHNEQPRRGRASTPRRHNTPKRHVTPPRPVVIRAEAPPAPAPAAPTHPWLTPETNWEEDPWTRAEREHAEQQEARAKAKAPPPPAPYSTQEPPAGPPVTPSINPPRQHRVEQTPITRAFETLRQTAGSSVQSIPASVPAPSPAPTSTELTQMTAPADANLMTQSWNLISGFPTTPSPPRIPDTILAAWFERPPIQFTRQLPPTHMHGMPSLLREDSSFQLNSQLLTEFTSLLENHYPVSIGTWGTIIQGNMTPQVPGHQHFDRLQLIPMASETHTADASLLKFWWHQHLLLARNVVQERFANSRAGPTIISDHLQAFLLTAINLMKMARPVGPPYELRQPQGPALASLAETLLDTLQGTMTMDMKMGIATGHIGELVMEGDHRNSRLVFYRTINWADRAAKPRSQSPTQPYDDDCVDVWEPGTLLSFTHVPYMIYINSVEFWFSVDTVHIVTGTKFTINTLISVHILLMRAAMTCCLWTHFVRTRQHGTLNTQFTDHIDHRWTSGSWIPIFRPRPVVAKQAVPWARYLSNTNHDTLKSDRNDPYISCDSIHFESITFHTYRNIPLLLSIPSTASAFGINPPLFR